MAHLHEYKCEGCGLEGSISGGPDALFAGYTNSYYCEKCETLSDLLDPFGVVATPVECSYCHSRQLITWTKDQPCPRCGGNLKRDPNGLEIMAD